MADPVVSGTLVCPQCGKDHLPQCRAPVFNVTSTRFERREDGVVMTMFTAEGRTLEKYMTFQEFFELGEQFRAMDPRNG